MATPAAPTGNSDPVGIRCLSDRAAAIERLTAIAGRTADGQLLAGFRIHPGSLPADSELARMLQQVADPSAGAA